MYTCQVHLATNFKPVLHLHVTLTEGNALLQYHIKMKMKMFSTIITLLLLFYFTNTESKSQGYGWGLESLK